METDSEEEDMTQRYVRTEQLFTHRGQTYRYHRHSHLGVELGFDISFDTVAKKEEM